MAYIYKHTRKDNGEVFYVGLSLKNDPKHGRAYSRGDRRNTHWKNIVNNTEYEVHIIEDNLTPDEAIAKEKEYIALYGRKDLGLGTLCNFTDGGESGTLGHRHTEEWKKNASERQLGELNHMYGKNRTKESIQIGIEARSWYKHSEDVKSRLREMRLGELNPNYGKTPSEETLEKMRAASTGRKHSEETKKKLSEMFSGENGPNYGKSPSQETRNKIGLAHKGKVVSDETREKLRITSTLRVVSDETRLKQSLARKGKRTGADDPKSQLILDKETGIFYVSIREAYYTIGFKCTEKHFQAMLRGDYPNKTSCVKV